MVCGFYAGDEWEGRQVIIQDKQGKSDEGSKLPDEIKRRDRNSEQWPKITVEITKL